MPIQHLSKERPPKQNVPRTEHHRSRESLFWWKIVGAVLVTVIVFASLLSYRILAAVNTTTDRNARVSIFTQLSHLVSQRGEFLRGEAEGRINILLLGIGGEGHEGPLLADTIIVASIKPTTGQVALLSIPRDLAVPIPRAGTRKINSANALGPDIGYPGGGEKLTADVVASVIGQPIHYYARVDFSGFTQIVDDLGGIVVNVERSFVDRAYPAPNFKFQTVQFSAGRQRMYGETALKFVRSRHGNDENTDFARSRRQQLVLAAVKDRALSLGTILNPGKIGNVLSSLGAHTKTNLEVWELLRLGRMARNITPDAIISRVFDTGPDGPLTTTRGIDGAYLLVPKDNTFQNLQRIVGLVFVEPQIQAEQAKIIIRAAPGRLSLAHALGRELEQLQFPRPTVEGTSTAQASATRILDYTGKEKIYSLSGLESILNITSESNVSPLLDPRTLAIADQSDTVNTVSLPPKPRGGEIVVVLGTAYGRNASVSD